MLVCRLILVQHQIHFNMVRNISLSVHIFIPTLKIELISWQVDLVGVDLVAIDLVRIDLMTPSHSRVGKSVDNESTLQSCQPSLFEQQSQHLGLGALVQASDHLVHGGIEIMLAEVNRHIYK